MKLGIIRDNENRQNTPAQKPSVVIAPNLKRERVLLDANGNEINNFKAKQIINKVEQE